MSEPRKYRRHNVSSNVWPTGKFLTLISAGHPACIGDPNIQLQSLFLLVLHFSVFHFSFPESLQLPSIVRFWSSISVPPFSANPCALAHFPDILHNFGVASISFKEANVIIFLSGIVVWSLSACVVYMRYIGLGMRVTAAYMPHTLANFMTNSARFRAYCTTKRAHILRKISATNRYKCI